MLKSMDCFMGEGLNVRELMQVTLEPYERDHAVVVGVYRYQKKSS
jgi:fibrillarin-like rRNA methylase